MVKALIELVTEEYQARLTQETKAARQSELPRLPEFAYFPSADNDSDAPLPKPGVTGTSHSMDHELVDTKIALSEARADLKFAELSAKVDRLAEQLGGVAKSLTDDMTRIRTDNLETRSTVRTWGLSVAALVIAVPGVIGTILFGALDFADKHPAIVTTPTPIVIQSQPFVQTPAPKPSPFVRDDRH